MTVQDVAREGGPGDRRGNRADDALRRPGRDDRPERRRWAQAEFSSLSQSEL
jgi:hypothetical protein